MMRFTQGNLLDARVDAVVNTVNTVGVMGKGIALMFKERFPENYKAYAAACKAEAVRVGEMFVTASVEKRAQRRLKELQDKGLEAIYATVLADMQERDERDRNRSVAPLVPAEDATVLDTSDLDADQAFAVALEIVNAKR